MTIDWIDELERESACGPPDLRRDLPLTFRWRTDSKAIAALGLAPARSGRHDDARNAVLTEAKLAYDRNSWVSFPAPRVVRGPSSLLRRFIWIRSGPERGGRCCGGRIA